MMDAEIEFHVRSRRFSLLFIVSLSHCMLEEWHHFFLAKNFRQIKDKKVGNTNIEARFDLGNVYLNPPKTCIFSKVFA